MVVGGAVGHWKNNCTNDVGQKVIMRQAFAIGVRKMRRVYSTFTYI